MRPTMEAVKANFGLTPLCGAELGILIGDNAIDMMKNLNIRTLHVVDNFSISHEKQQKDAEKHLAEYSSRVAWHIGDSYLMAKEVEDDSLDFVYIDADHTYQAVKKDLVAWFPKLKSGGIFGGHDFFLLNNPGVEPAVREFTKARGYTFETEKNDWWLIKP